MTLSVEEIDLLLKYGVFDLQYVYSSSIEFHYYECPCCKAEIDCNSLFKYNPQYFEKTNEDLEKHINHCLGCELPKLQALKQKLMIWKTNVHS